VSDLTSNIDAYTAKVDAFITTQMNDVRESNEKQLGRTHEAIESVLSGALQVFEKVYLLLETMGVISYSGLAESHDDNCHAYSSRIPQAACDHRLVAEVLHSLMARACTTSQVIHHSIANGYEMESLTLLRSVYEALVFATVVGGDDTLGLGVRYHDFAAVKGYRYRKLRSRWIEAPEWPNDESVQAYIDRYLTNLEGFEGYGDDYEWARSATNRKAKEHVRFADLEGAAGISDERRSLYRIMCDAAHVSPLGALSHWRSQIELDSAFVPVATRTTVLASVPDVLVASSCMLADMASAVADYCVSNFTDDALVAVNGWIQDYAQALPMLISDMHNTARPTMEALGDGD
jgi:hypothetical protein